LPSASASFADGRAAFEREDFAGALAGFESALAAGMSGPAVHYNIGVAAFRLQRYERAKAAFVEVSRTPSMAGLAHYNLGLIAKAQSNTDLAREHFSRAYEESQDEKIRALARSQLDSVVAPVSAVTWAGFGAAGAGYDDNVTLSAGGTAVEVAKESASYVDLLLTGSALLGERWRLDGDVTYLDYFGLDGYDQLGFNIGARYRLGFEEWRTDLGAQLGATFLDGNDFEQRQTLFVQSTRTLDDAWFVRLRYRLGFVDGADEFAGLDGLRHDAAARFTYSDAAWQTSFGYRLEVTDYDSAALSATRHHVFVDSSFALTTRWTLRGSVALRHSEYDDEAVGKEDRIDTLGGVEYRLDRRWTVVVQYLFANSNADTDVLDYRRNRAFIGVEVTL
jgi:tetratricopeptide (TPR) repeat protein